MKAFVPCHSSTPKSASKSSVSVYHGTLPAHPLLQARDVGLGRARHAGERRVASVQMRQVGDLIGHQRAAGAAALRPAADAGLEEEPVDDQLAAALEEVEQRHRPVRALERVRLVHRRPRHPPALGRQRVAGAGLRLLLDQQRPARGLPLIGGHPRGRGHVEIGHRVLLVDVAAGIGGLNQTSQPDPRFGQRSAQCVPPPLELRALDGVGAERDRPLVRARGAAGVARAAQQLGVRRVQRLVALERADRRAAARAASRPAAGPSAKPTATARLSSTTGDGLSWASAP